MPDRHEANSVHPSWRRHWRRTSLSLLYLLRQLDRIYEPAVLTLKHGPVIDLYRAEGIETYVDPGISDFSHTTLEWYGGYEWWRLPGKLLRLIPRFTGRAPSSENSNRYCASELIDAGTVCHCL
jgi:hypothetical protein